MENFFERFRLIQKQRIPTRLNIYRSIDKAHAIERKKFLKKWQNCSKQALPQEIIDYYNQVFSDVESQCLKLLSRPRVNTKLRQKVHRSYGARLKSGATLKQLLELDVFGPITAYTDFPLTWTQPRLQSTGAFRRRLDILTYHFFLHRPQQTECLFFHEIIVGYFIHVMINSGKIPKKIDNLKAGPLYGPVPAFILRKIAIDCGLSEAQLLALHFSTNNEIRKVLPNFYQELMLLAGHLYWIVEYFQSFGPRKRTASEILSLISLFFINPSIDLYQKNRKLRLRLDIGKWVDQGIYQEKMKWVEQQHAVISDSELQNFLKALTTNSWQSGK